MTTSKARETAFAIAAVAVATGAMLSIRSQLDKAHVALVYVVVVLATGARGGRSIGIGVALSAFVLFNFLFLPPYYTLVINDPFDWLVLVAFLITSVFAAELLDRQQKQAELARTRAAELDRLATLGAETLNAARADQALRDIAEVICGTVNVEACELFVWDGERNVLEHVAQGGAILHPVADSTPLMTYVASERRSAIERADGTIHVIEMPDAVSPASPDNQAKAFAIPLIARDQRVGALRISSGKQFKLTTDQWRILTALAYYAALAIYRLKLERAEEATENLRNADRLKDALLAAVSHDLRTPLTTIKGIAHEISSEDTTRGKLIEDEADRLARIVDGLLEMSQLDAGSVKSNVEVNTADDLIGAALERAHSVLNGRTVNIDIPRDHVLAGRFDFNQSLRILVNLLENAAKYSARPAPIDVTAAMNAGSLEISVSDSGRGIPPSERDSIFQPFYRSAGLPADVRGAGLGLSIARKLADLQGGSLTVDDSAAGGSRFTLALPAA